MLYSFSAAATAAVGGEGEDYVRGIVVLGLRVRGGEVEVLEYERRNGVRFVREGDLFGRVVLDMVVERLEPIVESMDSR